MTKFKIKKFIVFIYLLFTFEIVNAEIYDEIRVNGNERLSVETIIMFSGLTIGQDITNKELNISIKNLYKTNYFKDIKIKANNKTLEISIIENPIIQSIKINGIKNKSILNEILEVTKKMKNTLF